MNHNQKIRVRSSLTNISISKELENDEIEVDYDALVYKTTIVKIIHCKKSLEVKEIIDFVKKE